VIPVDEHEMTNDAPFRVQLGLAGAPRTKSVELANFNALRVRAAGPKQCLTSLPEFFPADAWQVHTIEMGFRHAAQTLPRQLPGKLYLPPPYWQSNKSTNLVQIDGRHGKVEDSCWNNRLPRYFAIPAKDGQIEPNAASGRSVHYRVVALLDIP
jgi:hypothetical protein